jgi:radical SAM superfamily enzyme YgiQ (UPF0313 family)
VSSRRLKVVYILPSRYDEEGYVLRFWRGVLPSNTLCCLKSLTCDLVDSGELGDDVALSVEIYDDSVQRVPVERIIRQSRRQGAQLLVGMVGVQTNQLPRATDLALEFRGEGVPVMIGGFHVSGVLALFGEPSPELTHLLNHGVTLVRGEVESPGVLAGILRDALSGEMKPIYSVTEAPDISEAPIPQPDSTYLSRFVWANMGTIDTSRGCPFNCSFCTIINVQGRTMRHRSAAGILTHIDENYDRGIDFYFFTDDNIARSPVWEELFDGLIRLRQQGKDVRFMMQVDTQAWRIPKFVEKAAAAGCYLVFIGMESINEDNLIEMGKRQNKVHQFGAMVETWHQAKVLVHVGYIIGLPHDTPESIRHDIAVLKDHIKVDEASFFMLIPLPGSHDHVQMVRKKVPLDADLNNYDSTHETFRHPHLAPGEWTTLYNEAWETFYSKESIVNVLLRTPRDRYWQMFWLSLWNRYSTALRTHPMLTGLVRLKDRRARRPFFARESLPRYVWRRVKDTAALARVFGRLFFEFQEIWLLTHRKDDPRWLTLADLRVRWAEVESRIAESDLAGRCDIAAREVHGMLKSASEHLDRLSGARKALSSRVRGKLRRKAQEIDNYLQTFELQKPTWHQVLGAERYIKDNLLAGYEEVAIRYVAKRRQFNAYRRDLVDRMKTGRILTLNVSTMPALAVFELVVGLRFGVAFLLRL